MSEQGRVVSVDSMAHGGAGVARMDGKVVFVEGGVPGDVVEVAITHDDRRFRRGRVARVVRPSPDRVEPPCPVFDRCGGCDWQMGAVEAQGRWKADIVRGQMIHLGGVESPPVADTRPVGPAYGYRNRIDLRVSGGKPALYEAGSHRPVEIDHCPQVVEAISGVIAVLEPDPSVDRITLRASERTGEFASMERRRGRWSRARLHEMVAGMRFRITGRAFFQVNTAGADVLVALVAECLDLGPGDVLLDGYAGGGLFSATVGADAAAVVAVESDHVACGDLAANAPGASIVRMPFHRSAEEIGGVDAAVVDPPRTGLGRDAVAVLVDSDVDRLAYVSCDPASFARDTRDLTAGGFALESVVPVDMFPQTHHVELVAGFVR